MYAVAPIASRKRGETVEAAAERQALIKRLKSYRRRALVGDGKRRARDRRGLKLAKGQHFDGMPTPGALQITSNLARRLIEQKLANITRNNPMPMVQAIDPAQDDGADLLEAGLRKIWADSSMQTLIKQMGLQAAFTGPVLWYTYWDQDRDGGIGQLMTRGIPNYRSIIDDRFTFVNDMEFIGFWETATRAKLIKLFPDKADEIEEACEYSGDSPGSSVKNPLRDEEPTSGAVTDRLVQEGPMQPYQGVTSINTRKRGKGDRDPLSEEVEVEYLWIDDPTPTREERPKRTPEGRPVQSVVRDEQGEIQFEHDGYEVVDSHLGPLYQPRLKPMLQTVFETCIVKKYKFRRHIAWIPQDGVILWDVAWNKRIPLVCQRDTLPIEGYQEDGSGQRLCTLQMARNIFWSIIFQRLRLSLAGTFLATRRSGLSANKLIPEPGIVYPVNDAGQDAIREFPVAPIDAGYFKILDLLEKEMMTIVGASEVQQGQSAGRVDNEGTYDKLIEQANTSAIDPAHLLEASIKEWAAIQIDLMQTYYTHEHMVPVETFDGGVTWKTASALAVRGRFTVDVETGAMVTMSESAQFARAQQYAGLGIYPLPMLVKMGHVPHGMRALQMKLKIMQNPQLAQALLGGAGAPPTAQSANIRAQGRRSHHAPGGR